MNRSFSTKCNKEIKYAFLFMLLIVLLILLICVNICAGSVQIKILDVIHILLSRQQDSTTYDIIWQIRFPRAVAAMLLGGGLALSGYLLQTFFHNPIAGPFVLGISSGAKLIVSISMILFISRGILLNSFMLIFSAFIGAMISMGFVLIISRKIKKSSMLVIGGIMIGYICSAITDIIITFANDSDIVNLHNWSMGSFSGMTWNNVLTISIVILTVTLITFIYSKPIGAYQMGETYAQNMGVNIMSFRVILVLLSSILSACVTAFAGPISFVGIAVPQLIKNLFKTSKPIFMIPGCFLGGGVFCLFCDLIARVLFAPTEMSISTVTAVFGAPVVIFIIIKKKTGIRGEIE